MRRTLTLWLAIGFCVGLLRPAFAAESKFNYTTQPTVETSGAPSGAHYEVVKIAGSANSPTVQGMAADNATASGSPLAIGGVDDAGKSQWVAVDSTGRLVFGLSETMADALGNVASLLSTPFGDQNSSAPLATFPFVYNGATWDRLPGTTAGVKTTLANGADTATGSTTDAVATGDANGSVIAHLRYLDKAVADIWDTTNHAVVNRPIAATALSYTGAQMGFNSTAVTNGATTIGTSVSCAGYKYIGITVQGTQAYTFYLLFTIGGVQGVSAGKVNGTSTSTNGTASNTQNVVWGPIAADSVAVAINNTAGSSGNYTVTATLLP